MGRYADHHAYPKYIGGADDQILERLPELVHQVYHAGLSKIFQGSRAEFMALPEATQVRVWQAFETYTRWFDQTFKTSLLEAARREGFSANGVPR